MDLLLLIIAIVGIVFGVIFGTESGKAQSGPRP